MSFIREPNAEPIPGYRLIEPLGSGGFGEVWKCEAPGGLFKAIKFVFNGLLLALPLPIPFTNAIAAWPALFLLLAGLRRDGVMLITGLLLTLLTVAAFAGIAIAAWLGVAWATTLWQG